MKRNKKFIIFLTVVTLLIMGNSMVSCKTSETVIDNAVVKELNIEKYLGTWYEIARYV